MRLRRFLRWSILTSGAGAETPVVVAEGGSASWGAGDPKTELEWGAIMLRLVVLLLFGASS